MGPKHLQRKRNVWQSVCLLCLAALLLVVPGFPGLAGAQSYPMIQNTDPQQSASAVKAYWTPEKMAAAIPKDMSPPGGPNRAGIQLPSGPPGLAGGSRPGQNTMQGPGLLSASELTSAVEPADGPYPGPNDTFEYYPRFTKYPVSTVGKLFFTEPSGNYVCSGAVVDGGSPDTIWTAGHCVANGGQQQFYSNFLFCPSYDAGAPLPSVGCWSWTNASTSVEWYYNGAFTRDYAIIIAAPTGTVWNTHIRNITGGLGFAWNWPRDQHWIHLGYPSASPWTGNKIIETAAEHRYDDTPDGYGPPTNSWGSKQTPGSSGSAVILFFNYVSASYVNSDVSYYYSNPNQYGIELQGPYFDTQVCNFFKYWTGYSGGC